MNPITQVRTAIATAAIWMAYAVFKLISVIIAGNLGYVKYSPEQRFWLFGLYSFVIFTIFPLAVYILGLVWRDLKIANVAYWIWCIPLVIPAVVRWPLPLFVDGGQGYTRMADVVNFIIVGLLVVLLGLGVQDVCRVMEIHKPRDEQEP